VVHDAELLVEGGHPERVLLAVLRVGERERERVSAQASPTETKRRDAKSERNGRTLTE